MKPSKRLARAIAHFRLAEELLKQAEELLNIEVQPKLKACKTVETLNELADLMPARYRGTRKIYEMIYVMEDDK